MPLNWPTNPSPGDTFIAPNGSPYIFTADGAWKANSVPPTPATPEAKSWTSVNRPPSPAVGRSGYNTTTNNFEVWNGTAWISVSGANIVTASVPPLNPRIGDQWFDTDTDTLYIRLNSTAVGNPIWFDIVGGTAQAGSNKSPFNSTFVDNKIRTPLAGIGFVPFSSGTYVKRSNTSQLIVRVTSNVYSTSPTGAAAGQVRTVVGGQECITVCSNSDPALAKSASNGSFLLLNLPAGNIPWAISFGRSDNLSWQTIVNPSQVDTSYLPPTGTNTMLEFSELEPV